jgi:sulfate/thiosulfate transport system permease protein
MISTSTSKTTATGTRGSWVRWALIGIVVAYAGLLILLPLGGLVAGVLTLGAKAILATFADPNLQAAFALTLRVSVITVLVNGVLGLVVAWILARSRFPGRNVVNALIDLPFALSPVVAGYLFILIFGRLGPLASLEDSLNISVVFAEPGVIIATIFVTLPLMIREMIPVIAALDREQEHAAATLGARWWQIFRLVTLPAIRWGLLYGIALTFARALGEFGAVLVVGNDIQGSTETAPLYIYRAINNNDFGSAFVVALALGALSLALVASVEWLRRRHTRPAGGA